MVGFVAISPSSTPPLTRSMRRLSPRRRGRRPRPQPRNREETTKSRRCVTAMLCAILSLKDAGVGGLERRFQEETGRRIRHDVAHEHHERSCERESLKAVEEWRDIYIYRRCLNIRQPVPRCVPYSDSHIHPGLCCVPPTKRSLLGRLTAYQHLLHP